MKPGGYSPCAGLQPSPIPVHPHVLPNLIKFDYHTQAKPAQSKLFSMRDEFSILLEECQGNNALQILSFSLLILLT